jgi:hypothetical protein
MHYWERRTLKRCNKIANGYIPKKGSNNLAQTDLKEDGTLVVCSFLDKRKFCCKDFKG